MGHQVNNTPGSVQRPQPLSQNAGPAHQAADTVEDLAAQLRAGHGDLTALTLQQKNNILATAPKKLSKAEMAKLKSLLGMNPSPYARAKGSVRGGLAATATALVALVMSPVALITWVAASLTRRDSQWKQQKYEDWMAQVQGDDRVQIQAQLHKLAQKAPLTSFEKKAKKALELLVNNPPKTTSVRNNAGQKVQYLNWRDQHHKFLRAFREACQAYERDQNGANADTVALLGQMATRMRTGDALNANLAKNMHALAHDNDNDAENLKAGLDQLSGAQRGRSFLDVAFGKFRGAQNINFDPSVFNLSSKIAEVIIKGPDNNTRTVDIVRMATPTIERGLGGAFGLSDNAELTPEYVMFLRHYQQTGKKHLDVVKQRLTGNERFRSLARLEAASDPFAGTLFAICLPDDGDLVKMKGKFSGPKLSYSTFKKDAIDHMLTSKEYSLPQWLDLNKQEFGILFNNARDELWPGKLSTMQMTPDERKLLLDTVYAKIEMRALTKSGATSMNITCKDGIDRGAVGTNIFLRMADAGAGATDSNATAKNLEDVYISGAFQSKQQTPIKSRHQNVTRYQGHVAGLEEHPRFDEVTKLKICM